MKKGLFATIITVGVVVLLFLIFIAFAFGTKNSAISYEEKIEADISDIGIIRKKTVKTLEGMKDAINSSNKLYTDIVNTITEARKSESELVGNFENSIKFIMEAYPSDIGNAELYKTYMNELAMAIDNIAAERLIYNDDVRKYKTLCRKFPNTMFLGFTGYNSADYVYLTVDDSTGDL